jgi:hypothetical protein
MTDGTFSNPTPQFGTAEYVGSPGGDHCQFCHQPIAGNYYRANGAMTCPGCAEKVKGEKARDTHSAFVRAVLFGVGAAVVGMILYAAFEIMTGISIGYAALAVGWMIGKAMITGSSGVGGRRYQIVAVLLTYFAVSTAAVPVMIDYVRKHPEVRQSSRQNANPDNLNSDSGSQTQPTEKHKMDISRAIGALLLFGLASPFLELFSSPLSGLIGLVILFVGMQFAWRFTAGRPIELLGPFADSPRPV